MKRLVVSIQGRAALIVLAGLVALVVSLGSVLERVVEPTFAAIERREARVAADRIREAMRAELEALDRLAYDWAAWDDSYAFLQDWSDDYVSANLQPSALDVLGIDLLVFVDDGGRVIWSGLLDDSREGLAAAQGFMPGSQVPDPALVALPGTGSRVMGLWRWGEEVLQVAVRPVTDTEEEETPNGAILMARRVDADRIAGLAGRLRLDLAPQVLPPATGPGNVRSAPRGDTTVTALDDAFLAAEVALRDIQGRPLLALSARLPRDVMSAARETLATAWGVAVTAIVGVVGLIAVTLQVLIVRPLLDLRRAVVGLAEGKEAEVAGLPVRRRDEIGAVARSIGKMHARISHLAHHDMLTGLPNRLSFAARARRIIETAREQHQLVAAMVIDLDRFKPVNDTYGHDAGDGVLREAASRMTQAVRDSDVVSRVGGDEFVVLCSIQTDAQAAEIAERIVRCMERPFTLEAGAQVQIGCSVGLTVCRPDDKAGLDHLLALADQAMYDAKRAGRGRWQVVTEAATAAAAPAPA